MDKITPHGQFEHIMFGNWAAGHKGWSKPLRILVDFVWICSPSFTLIHSNDRSHQESTIFVIED